MASVKEYCKKLSTSQLQALLREECAGRGDLPIEVILMICEILAERNPAKPPVMDKIYELCRSYLDE